jgi:hypothetical protein
MKRTFHLNTVFLLYTIAAICIGAAIAYEDSLYLDEMQPLQVALAGGSQ